MNPGDDEWTLNSAVPAQCPITGASGVEVQSLIGFLSLFLTIGCGRKLEEDDDTAFDYHADADADADADGDSDADEDDGADDGGHGDD
jgi:hypothetical protein